MTTRTIPATATQLRSIVSGPNLFGFLEGALKNTAKPVTFTLESSLRGGAMRNALGVDVKVTITDAQCEDGSGLLFIFGGTWQRPGRVLEGQRSEQRIEGFYNTKTKTGWIRPLN